MCATCNKCETVCFDRWHLMIYDTYELTKIHDLNCRKWFDVELSCFIIKRSIDDISIALCPKLGQ